MGNETEHLSTDYWRAMAGLAGLPSYGKCQYGYYYGETCRRTHPDCPVHNLRRAIAAPTPAVDEESELDRDIRAREAELKKLRAKRALYHAWGKASVTAWLTMAVYVLASFVPARDRAGDPAAFSVILQTLVGIPAAIGAAYQVGRAWCMTLFEGIK